ncbi:unnamed protein product [Mycena citricolor]|uniref:NAD(P)-binding protein n=2 Tax=Mycena citricolor TaxID=2018698 RepID=A0AAD2HG72_9AGAR|nr:unnamed protein product [Mycena citricolor]
MASPLVWFITGTSTGLGKTLVSTVLARGDLVIATARTLSDIDTVWAGNPNVRTRQLDVTSGPAAIKAVVDEAAGFWGRLDVVVNNAGAGLPGLLEEGGTEVLRRQFEINLFGPFDVLVACLPHLRKRKSGTVVIVGSRSAWKTELVGLGQYSASKAAVHSIAETLAAEIAPLGIRVLLVEPGAFNNGMYRNPYFTENPISDYDTMRQTSIARFAAVPGTEKGDRVKAMELLADVVRGEGKAAGRPWPGRLPLGEDAERDMRIKCKRVVDGLDQWTDLISNVNLDSVQES